MPGALAPRLAAWQRVYRGTPGPFPAGPSSPVTFPTTPLRVLVEIAPGADLTANPTSWSWSDVTAYVRYNDGIRITRGRSDESSAVPPSTCRLTFDNTGGNFVADNPYGLWYPNLDIGTPLRVSVDPGSGMVPRFTGRIYSLPPRWDTSGNYSVVQVTANGVLRSLRSGTPIAEDPITSATVAASPIAYWPCTDAATATKIASGLVGGTKATLSGAVASNLHEVTGPDGSSKYPNLDAGGLITGTVPSSTSTSWTTSCIAMFDSVLDASSYAYQWHTSSLQWFVMATSGGAVQVQYTADADTPNSTACTVTMDVVDDLWHTYRVSAEQVGTGISVRLYVDSVLKASGTISSATNTKLTHLIGGDWADGSDGNLSVGQLTAYDVADLTTSVTDAATNFEGEQAGHRFNRLLDAAGYPVAPAAWHSVEMGVQPAGTLPDLLDECVDAEIGIITDTVTGEFDLHTRSRREDAPIAMTIDADQRQMSANFEPDNSDRLLRNRWTLTMAEDGGDSVTVEDTTSIRAKGIYADSKTVNLDSIDDLQPLAEWRLHQGNQTGLRHPTIGINLTRTPSLIPAALALDISSRIVVTNPPDEMAPDQVDVVIEQINEFIVPNWWLMDFATSPFKVWRVGVWADATGSIGEWGGRWDWDSMVLAAAIDSTQTSITVTATPLLTTVTADLDLIPRLYIYVGGERMLVTACSGVANPQTLTVTRSVNTIVKTHAVGAAVTMDVYSGLVLGA